MAHMTLPCLYNVSAYIVTPASAIGYNGNVEMSLHWRANGRVSGTLPGGYALQSVPVLHPCRSGVLSPF